MKTTGSELHAAIAERVAQAIDGRVEAYRMNRLASAPEFARFMYEGVGWQQYLKGDGGKQLVRDIEDQLWREAICEALARLVNAQQNDQGDS